MTRNEMLNKLHIIPVSVRLTVLESESALECLYMTSKGTKEEWIGINEWPVSVIEDTNGINRFLIKIEGDTHSFDDYDSFADFFEEKWIGEVRSWEEYSDEALEEWIELIKECNGIPFLEL